MTCNINSNKEWYYRAIKLMCLIVLTIWISISYVFYGYLAFFRDSTIIDTNLPTHVISTITQVWCESWYAGLFVTLLPVTFLGSSILFLKTGVRHGSLLFVKTFLLHLLTLLFDSLLAIQIAAKMVTSSSDCPLQLYCSILQDLNFWIVTLVLFIPFVIWNFLLISLDN